MNLFYCFAHFSWCSDASALRIYPFFCRSRDSDFVSILPLNNNIRFPLMVLVIQGFAELCSLINSGVGGRRDRRRLNEWGSFVSGLGLFFQFSFVACYV